MAIEKACTATEGLPESFADYIEEAKDNAESYGINSDRVFVLGFSAE